MSQVLEMPSPLPQKSKSKHWPGILLCILMASAGLGYWIYAGRIVSSSAPLQAHMVPIVSPMSSTVLEVLAQEGEAVSKGQKLVRLDASAYLQHEADARALTRGSSLPSAEDTQTRVAAAQAAEEYTVRRVAMARHEESTQRQVLEQCSAEHARTLVQLRDIDAWGTRPPAGRREVAQQAELQARIALDNAKGAFEAASRSRAAIELELRRIRQEVEKARAQGITHTSASIAPITAAPYDPTSVLAPADGYVFGKLPAKGQRVLKGESIFSLIPQGQLSMWLTVNFTAHQGKDLQKGQQCFIVFPTTGSVYTGNIDSILPPEKKGGSTAYIPVKVSLAPLGQGLMPVPMAGQEARVTVWTNTLPGWKYYSPLLLVLSKL